MKTLFNDGWQFAEAPIAYETMYKDGKPVLFEPTDFLNEASKQDYKPVYIPHDWMISDTKQLYRNSIGYYKKDFDIEEISGKHYALLFEGVYMNSAVFVNGKLAGIWRYGYAQFEYDISSLVQKGKNQVLVIVVYQSPNTRWYSGAGIFRDVSLIETGNNFLVTDGNYIRVRKLEEKKWSVKVSTEAALENDNCKIHYEVLRKNSSEVIVSADANLTQLNYEENEKLVSVVSGLTGRNISKAETELTVENPDLWDCENPNLYILKIDLLSSDGIILDSKMENLGFRTVEFNNNSGMYLNGVPTKLYGVCQHHDLGGLGSAFNIFALRRQFIRLKEMGVNAIRTSHNPITSSFMDLADEMGILIDNDGYDMWESTKTTFDYGNYFNDWCERDTASWVRKDRNHPSLIMWSFGNEIYDTHEPNGVGITKRLSKYVRDWDPEKNAVTTIASNYMMTEGACECAEYTDVVGYNYLERLYDEHHKKYPEWKIYGSETSSTIQSRGIYHFPLTMNLVTHDDRQCSTLGNCTTTWGCESTQRVITNDRDAEFSSGQFIWTGWDYIGEPTPYNNTSKSSYFGQIDTAGFWKDTAWLYKAEWGGKRFEPFVHLLPYWDWNIGQKIDVKAYTNCSSVELFLNGRSLGCQKIDHEKDMNLFGLWSVVYEKGEIKAVGYDENGNKLCEDVKKSFGDPAKIMIETETFDGSCHLGNMYFFDIMTVDKDGIDVANARNVISVKVEGDAEFVCMDNGDSTDYDQYVSNVRRLFGNRLLVMVRAKTEKSDFTVTAVSKGLTGYRCIIGNGELLRAPGLGMEVYEEPEPMTDEELVENFGEYAKYVPVRKIEQLPQGDVTLSKENKKLKLMAKVLPENASSKEITFVPMLPTSVLSDAVEVEQNGIEAELNAVCDGDFIMRVSANNGYDYPEIISELDMKVQGVGNPKFNPYKLVEACRYTNFDRSKPEPKLAFTGGISTRGGGGGSWVSFDKVDFGDQGSDEIHIPAFCWSPSWKLKVYDGEPDSGELLFEGQFEAEYQYNTYTEKNFRLNKRLFGVHKISIWVEIELVWHGFRFTEDLKAFGKLRALDADTIVGDTFKKTDTAVEGIGNNVNLDFKNMDFGDKSEGAKKLTICGKSNKPNNSINLKWFGNQGNSTQVIEFPHTDDYEEKSFEVEEIKGKGQISFVFLPGCDFDFKWFKFE
ncbi:MAG: DUF4982 domain-containing protein [Treponema sp.]|nr:DUF4982 domain-containing protein [Treponema sp.]